jgi:hypothetical protein
MIRGRPTGQQLYQDWCGSAVSDRARYWELMNPADKRAWDELAARVTLDTPTVMPVCCSTYEQYREKHG